MTSWDQPSKFPVYSYYEQTWILMKKDELAESSVLALIYWRM